MKTTVFLICVLLFIPGSASSKSGASFGAEASDEALEGSGRGSDEVPSHEVWEELLGKYVADERVDYLSWATSEGGDRNRLADYLRRLAAVKVKELGRADRLAFFINLYNATMIQAVLDRLVVGWTPAADDFAVFKAPLVNLEGQRISLNHLENEIIRKEFKEPRIHAALVCGARSCPPLVATAFRGQNLEGLLQGNMRAFVGDVRRNNVDHDRRLLKLSKIFEWYGSDFGDVRAYVGKALGHDVSDYQLEFVDYLWDLNAAKTKPGLYFQNAEGRIFKRLSSPDAPAEEARYVDLKGRTLSAEDISVRELKSYSS